VCGLCAAHEILELPPWSKRGSGKSGGAGDSYLVHDIDSFKNLLLTKREPVPPSQASVFDVYCGPRVRCRRDPTRATRAPKSGTLTILRGRFGTATRSRGGRTGYIRTRLELFADMTRGAG
jgi:hypothetical protein